MFLAREFQCFYKFRFIKHLLINITKGQSEVYLKKRGRLNRLLARKKKTNTPSFFFGYLCLKNFKSVNVFQIIRVES